jgi:23S rRNA (uracil1939-C5)-methyltransferase
MDYAFGPDYTIGLKSDRNRIYDVSQCLLADEKDSAILNRLRYFVSFKKLQSYITKTGKEERGIMRHVVVRHGKNIQNTVLNIITSDKGTFPLEELWKKIKDLAQGVALSINLSPADRSYGEIQQILGQNYLLESLGSVKFKIPVQSFFQTNIRQAEKLLEIVKGFADLQGKETILDLYSGTGSIGLSLAGKAKRVIAVEENQEAIELSKANAELNRIENFSAIAGKVEKSLDSLDIPDPLVILDPPRAGVHKKVLKKLGAVKPKKIIYVSCNPDTQKHDLEILKEFGYKIEKCQPLDMFPHTPHIENVILLIKLG